MQKIFLGLAIRLCLGEIIFCSLGENISELLSHQALSWSAVKFF